MIKNYFDFVFPQLFCYNIPQDAFQELGKTLTSSTAVQTQFNKIDIYMHIQLVSHILWIRVEYWTLVSVPIHDTGINISASL